MVPVLWRVVPQGAKTCVAVTVPLPSSASPVLPNVREYHKDDPPPALDIYRAHDPYDDQLPMPTGRYAGRLCVIDEPNPPEEHAEPDLPF
jgi:hypothetical protein